MNVLADSFDRQLELYDELGTPVWRAGLDAQCIFFNKAWLRFTGRSMEEELGDGWAEGVHSDDREDCIRRYKEAFAARRTFQLEYRLRTGDGSYRWVLDHGKAVFAEDGRFLGYIGTCIDIDERKASEEAARNSERRFRGIFDSTFQFIGLLEPDGTLLEANRAALRFGGLREDEVVGRKFWDIGWWSYSPEVQYRLRDAIVRASKGELVRYEEDVRGAGDAMRTIDFSLNPITDDDGRVVLLIPEGRDITKTKQAERAFRNVVEGTSGATGMALFELLARHIALAVGTRYGLVGELSHPEGDAVQALAVSVNGEPGDRLEYPVSGTPCEDVMSGRGALVYERCVQAVFTDDLLLRRLGVESYAGIPLFDAAGNLMGLLAVMHDAPLQDSDLVRSLLTVFGARAAAELERQRTEEQMRQHQDELAHVVRVSTVGEMATSIAHEVNQPLTAIANYALGAIRRLEDEDTPRAALAEALGQIARQADRAGEIIRHLRDFVRKRAPRVQDLEINGITRQAVQMIRGEIRRRDVQVRFDLSEDLPAVRGDPVQIEQVIINLLLNAVDALGGVPARDRDLCLRTGLDGDGCVRVTVADSGPGMQPDGLERMFEPFYTTKVGGLGMGLVISRSIIDHHDGRLWAEARAGGGLSFHFELPVGPRAASDG